MEWFVVWLIFSIIVGVGADARGRSGIGWFFLSFLISPLLAVILLFLIPTPQPKAAAQRKCPECAELILYEAKKCKHCGSTVEPVAVPKRQKVAMPTIRGDLARFSRFVGLSPREADAAAKPVTPDATRPPTAG